MVGDFRATRLRDRALLMPPRAAFTEPLAGLGLAVTIAGVAADAALPRGGVACASPVAAGEGGAPG